MYSTKPGLVLGFHGCDREIADKVISSNSGESLFASTNKYDWLGNGIYFWEHSPARALHYAEELKSKPRKGKKPLKEPAVVGTVLDLGYCLDLVNINDLELLKRSYESLKGIYKAYGLDLPHNTVNATPGEDDESTDLLQRRLDCLVIETLHDSMKEEGKTAFDSVRGVFWEGKSLYPGAGFRAKNHIQLCIRNPNCIKGYFRPRELNRNFQPV